MTKQLPLVILITQDVNFKDAAAILSYIK